MVRKKKDEAIDDGAAEREGEPVSKQARIGTRSGRSGRVGGDEQEKAPESSGGQEGKGQGMDDEVPDDEVPAPREGAGEDEKEDGGEPEASVAVAGAGTSTTPVKQTPAASLSDAFDAAKSPPADVQGNSVSAVVSGSSSSSNGNGLSSAGSAQPVGMPAPAPAHEGGGQAIPLGVSPNRASDAIDLTTICDEKGRKDNLKFIMDTLQADKDDQYLAWLALEFRNAKNKLKTMYLRTIPSMFFHEQAKMIWQGGFSWHKSMISKYYEIIHGVPFKEELWSTGAKLTTKDVANYFVYIMKSNSGQYLASNIVLEAEAIYFEHYKAVGVPIPKITAQEELVSVCKFEVNTHGRPLLFAGVFRLGPHVAYGLLANEICIEELPAHIHIYIIHIYDSHAHINGPVHKYTHN
jgi:hypothetical protein